MKQFNNNEKIQSDENGFLLKFSIQVIPSTDIVNIESILDDVHTSDE